MKRNSKSRYVRKFTAQGSLLKVKAKVTISRFPIEESILENSIILVLNCSHEKSFSETLVKITILFKNKIIHHYCFAAEIKNHYMQIGLPL